MGTAVAAAVKCAAKTITVGDATGATDAITKKITAAITSKIPNCKRRRMISVGSVVSSVKGALDSAACAAVQKLCSPACDAAATAALAGFPVSCFTDPVKKACTDNCKKICRR